MLLALLVVLPLLRALEALAAHRAEQILFPRLALGALLLGGGDFVAKPLRSVLVLHGPVRGFVLLRLERLRSLRLQSLPLRRRLRFFLDARAFHLPLREALIALLDKRDERSYRVVELSLFGFSQFLVLLVHQPADFAVIRLG